MIPGWNEQPTDALRGGLEALRHALELTVSTSSGSGWSMTAIGSAERHDTPACRVSSRGW